MDKGNGARFFIKIFSKILIIFFAKALMAKAIHEPYVVSLVRMIQEKNIQTVDELLPYLKQTHSSLSLHYVYKTSSPFQDANFQNPRIILSFDSGKILIALAGSSQMRGGELVEIIEFDENEKAFIPSTLNLKKVSLLTTRDSSKWLSKEGEAWGIRYRASICYQCHANSSYEALHFRPIWGSYPAWPGIYGSSHAAGYESLSEYIPNNEVEGLKLFVSSLDSESRYSVLMGPRRVERYKNLNQETLIKELTHVNVDISTNLNDLNVQRIVKMLEKELTPEEFIEFAISYFEGHVELEKEDVDKILQKRNGYIEQVIKDLYFNANEPTNPNYSRFQIHSTTRPKDDLRLVRFYVAVKNINKLNLFDMFSTTPMQTKSGQKIDLSSWNLASPTTQAHGFAKAIHDVIVRHFPSELKMKYSHNLDEMEYIGGVYTYNDDYYIYSNILEQLHILHKKYVSKRKSHVKKQTVIKALAPICQSYLLGK